MPHKRAIIITAVGAGGKTTYLERRAAEFVCRGMRAAVTTTTHIWKPETAKPSGSGAHRDYIFYTAGGTDYAGSLEESGKLSAPPDEVWDFILEEYDAVLVEGDGSHCMPVKIPREGEPVIPENTDEIAVIMGRQAIGRRLDVVCHRFDMEKLPSGIVTDKMLEEIADMFYIRPLKEKYPHARVFYSPSEYEPEHWTDLARLPELPVTAVLLASGFGRRYGGNKLLEDFDGQLLYLRALNHVTRALGKRRTVVVTQYPEIMNAMKAEGITALYNDSAAEGISASIRIGTKESLRREDTEAVIFFAADMPYLPSDEIRRYVHQFLWSGKRYGCMESGPEHIMTNPGAFRLKETSGQLLGLSGDRGAMRIMKQYPHDIYRYQIAETAVLDIDVR